MSTVRMLCGYCNTIFEQTSGEANRNRKLGRRAFCSRSCAAKAGNAPRKYKQVIKTCPCGKRVVSSDKPRAPKFCSRECASKNSMTEKRRRGMRKSGLATANLATPEEALKKREAWKYALLEEVLAGRSHEFEYRVGKYIFDLALLDTKVLVEFDGGDHQAEPQKSLDARKDQAAAKAGFLVIRRPVVPVTVIDPSTIEGL